MLDVLYEDNHCLAVNKPGGLLTQGVPEGLPTLEAQVRAYLKEKYHKPGRVYLGIPHRLDRPVSGVVLFARQTKSAQRLAEQFQQRTVEKIYWAAVQGVVQFDSGSWEDWLRKIPDEARSEITAKDQPAARHARLYFRRIQSIGDGTLLEIKLETGRMHQIRVQSASRGHPVFGDVLYGSTVPFGPPDPDGRQYTIALHARRLTFLHPIRYEPITVTARLPAAWSSLGIDQSVLDGSPCSVATRDLTSHEPGMEALDS